MADLCREMMMELSGPKHWGGKCPKERVGWKKKNSYFDATIGGQRKVKECKQDRQHIFTYFKI